MTEFRGDGGVARREKVMVNSQIAAHAQGTGRDAYGRTVPGRQRN